MFNFDIQKAAIYQAIVWSKTFRLAKILKIIFSGLFVFLLMIFLFGFISERFSTGLSKILLGATLISLAVIISSWMKEMFFELRLKRPRLKNSIEEVFSGAEEFNLAEFLSFDVARSVVKSMKFARSKRIPEINSSILTYFILKDNPSVNFIFSRSTLSLNEVREIFKSHIKTLERDKFKKVYSQDFRRTILKSFEIAHKKGHSRIEVGDVLTSLAECNSVLKDVLIEAKVKIEDIENLTWWLELLGKKIEKKKRFWEWENLIRKGSLGKEWASGYTVTLDKFSTDLTENIKRYGFSEIIGHEKEMDAIERILSRGEINNVLLVGEPGVGRNSIISAISEKSFLGKLRPEVSHKRFVYLDLASVATQTESQEELEFTLEKIFQEVIQAGNVVLIIENFHDYLRRVTGPGIINVSGIISRYLHFPEFQIIALTTFSGLHKYIEQNPSVLSLFGKVEAKEISRRETLMVLEEITLSLEQKHRLFVSYPALRDIVNFSDKYLQEDPFPKKAMDLLDEIMVYVGSTEDKIVMPKHVAKIFSDKTEIPVGEAGTQEKEKLLNLEELVHKRIINQNMAVSGISSALRRARAEITSQKGPMGTFLFLGPTGVGKTETAKALAEIYFGSERKMIRLDMSEFQAIKDIPRLIGSPGEEGLLTTKVREDPFSLVLLDEIEKAHPNILNLFLQVLDEGHITDGLGRKVSFKNTIIIATSNAGYLIILEAMEDKVSFDEIENKLLDYIFKNKIFRPEFINRFDGMIVFKSLTKDNLVKIAGLLLSKIKRDLAKKDIEFIVTTGLKKKIVELGYSPKFGAREMKRVIQDNVENILAEALLRGNLKRGDSVEVDSEEFKLIVNP